MKFVANWAYYQPVSDVLIHVAPSSVLSFRTDFYCATRMHSAYMLWQDVCLSVRLSVCHTPVLCLNGYTYPQSFFHRRVAPPF